MIYFDNAATTKIDDEILQKMYEFSKTHYANMDSIHNFGLEVHKFLEEKKSIFEKIFKKNKNLFHYTSGGSEANLIAIKSVLDRHKSGHIITTVFEHPSVVNVLKSYTNFNISYINPSLGQLTYEDIRGAITDETKFITLTSCNSELGIVYDIDDIAKKIKEEFSNIVIHTDFVQALGQKDINLEYIDLLSISSHKIHGPKGIGALYMNDKIKYKQIFFGDNKNSGITKRTMPNDLIYGFLLAIEKIDKNYHIVSSYMREKLKNIDDILLIENNSNSIISFSLKNTKSEIVFNYLSSKGIYVSVGSACSTGVSHVVEYMNLPKEYRQGLIRVSLSKYNTKEEVDIFIEEIKKIKKILR